MSDLGNKEIFSNNLKRLMSVTGKERTEICEALGFKYTTFTDWYNGKTYPRIDKIEMLANYFGIQKSDLIEKKPATSITELTKRLFPDWKPGDPIPDGSNSTWDVEARLDDGTLKMLENYFRLNEPGQLKAQQRIEELTKYNKYLVPAYKEKSSASNEAEEEVREMEGALRRMFEDLGLVEQGGDLSDESLEMIKGFLSLLRAQRRKRD